MSVPIVCALFGPTFYLAACSGGGAAVSNAGASVNAPRHVVVATPVPSQSEPAALSIVNDPGPNSAYAAAQPFYTCATNFFVSLSGSDGNDGKSPSTPWLTLKHAGAQTLEAGSCINISPGVYEQTESTVINHGGTTASASGYVVWRCTSMPFHFSNGALQGEGSGCVIRAGARFHGLPLLMGDNGSYVVFDGLEFDGNDNAVKSCLYIAPWPHHVIILDSDFHGCGAGFGARVDWLWVIHSVWHDIASNSNNGSGFSDWEPTATSNYTPTAADNAWCSIVPVSACFHVVIAYNVAYHNYDEQDAGGDGNTDGDGILLDTWNSNNYVAPALVMGNIVYNNGGYGIGCYNGAAGGTEVFSNNTLYGDGWDPHANFNRNELFSQGCYNATFINNIAYGVPGHAHPTTENTSIAAWKSGNAAFAGNIAFGTPTFIAPGFSFPKSGPNRNIVADPMYKSAAYLSNANNFALRPGSPALGAGKPFSLWNQTGTIDIGACPRTLANCP